MVTARIIEHLNGQSQDIARKGSVPKRSDTPPKITPGMVHVKDGAINAGISATQVGTALAGGKSPTDPPVIGKVLTPVTINPGCSRARSISATSDQEHRDLGAAVLHQGRLAIRGK